MNRNRFTQEQIITVLREHEAGAKAADLARKHGISEATLYNWKAKYGGLDVSEARRQAGSCRSSAREVPDERASGLLCDRGRSQDDPLSLVSATRDGAAGAVARAGQ